MPHLNVHEKFYRQTHKTRVGTIDATLCCVSEGGASPPVRCAIASTGTMPVGPTAKMAVLRTRLDQSVPVVFERVMFSIITAGG